GEVITFRWSPRHFAFAPMVRTHVRRFYRAYSAFSLGGDEICRVGRWGLLSHLDRRKLRQGGSQKR
ncbi:MAG: hypothetical protein ACI3X4_04090, partial [Bacteroidaceae bacterium]